MARLIWLTLAFSMGCSSNKGGDTAAVAQADADADTDADADADADQVLSFSLDSDTSIAGDSVGFVVAWDDGEASADASDYLIASDIEAPLSLAEDSLMATVAGTHVLTVTATDDAGVEQTASTELTVDPAALSVLWAQVSPVTIAAGEWTQYTVGGEDLYGNAIHTDDAVITIDDLVSTGEDGALLAEVAAEYNLNAALSSLSADASWTVVAAEPASVDLVIEDIDDLEAGDDTDYEVFVTDAFGNPCDVEVMVQCDDVDIIVDDDELEFPADGVFVCWATVSETALLDEETITIDGRGPELTVLTPERGGWTTEDSVAVTGFVEDAVTDISSLTVNGEDASFAGGTFDHEIDFVPGLNIIETIAEDSNFDSDGIGNQSSDVRSVLQADSFHDPGTYLNDGLVVRLQDDDGGLGFLEDLAGSMFSEADLASSFVGELFSASTTIGACPWFCTTVSATGYADSVTIGSIDLDIDTRASGIIVATVTINDVDADWHIVVTGPDVSGTVHADAVHVQIELNPYVTSWGSLVVPVEDIEVTREGFDVEVSGPLDSIAGWIGVDIEGMVWDELSSAIESEVEEAVPDMLSDTLGSLALDEDLEVMGNIIEMSARIAGLVVDDDGMDVRFKTKFTPAEVWGGGVEDGVTGSPVYGYDVPYWDDATGATLALSTDFLNQAFYAFWQGGVLDQELDAETLGLDMATVSLLLPGITDLLIVTTPMLPPVAMPRAEWEDGHEYDLQLGDLSVQLYNGEADEDLLYMELFVSAVAPLSLDEGSGSSISFGIGDADVYVDVVYTDPAYTVTPESTESLFADLMALYLPEITGAVGEIPLPEFVGYGLDIDESGLVGPDVPPGYWAVSGDLE